MQDAFCILKHAMFMVPPWESSHDVKEDDKPATALFHPHWDTQVEGDEAGMDNDAHVVSLPTRVIPLLEQLRVTSRHETNPYMLLISLHQYMNMLAKLRRAGEEPLASHLLRTLYGLMQCDFFPTVYGNATACTPYQLWRIGTYSFFETKDTPSLYDKLINECLGAPAPNADEIIMFVPTDDETDMRWATRMSTGAFRRRVEGLVSLTMYLGGVIDQSPSADMCACLGRCHPPDPAL